MAEQPTIAIIGAGLSGLTLALALHQQSIQCVVYESRDAPEDTGGSLQLVPNGLKALRGVGIYDGLLNHAWQFENAYFQHGESGKILETIEYGSVEKYGMRAVRVHRHVVVETLLNQVREKGIPIHFNRKFSRVVAETESSVTWEFTDLSRESASLLVGADGIHSTVRKYVAPDTKPVFGGTASVVAVVPTSQLKLAPEDLKDLTSTSNKHPMPCGIISKAGAFIVAPHNADECMITAMRRWPEEPENGRWSTIDSDKDRLRAMFRENVDAFPEVVANAVSDIPGKDLYIWPNYTLPHPVEWTSRHLSDGQGRVLIIGDAAHAIPPTAGQGASLAFEDAYLLALALGKSKGSWSEIANLQAVLQGWQSFRHSRIDLGHKLEKAMSLRRLPPAVASERGIDFAALKADAGETQDALFRIDYEEAVNRIIELGKQ